jgi:tetratricopeptide (TPR) repeat protein
LERDGVLVRFRHPLFGSLVYADASAPQRHQTHRLLAELVDEPEEQALHLALGTQDPNEHAAAGRLEDAAQRASARGAPDAAAQLAEHASRLTPVRWSPADCRRRLAASNYHARAGNGPRARALLEALIAHLPPGTTRAKALAALADLVTDDSWDGLFIQAMAEAADDLALRAQIERRHGRSKGTAGNYAAWERHAQAAVELAEAADDIAQLPQALAALGTVRMFRGRGVQHELMARALALESAGEVAIEQRPTLDLGMQLLFTDEFDQARHLLQAEAARALEHGSVDVRGEALLLLTELEIRTGNWPLADQYASECLELARQLDTSNGEPIALYGRALVDAHLGRVEAARAAAERGSALAAPMGDETFRVLNEWVLGFLELPVGDPAGAHARLGPLVHALHAIGVGEPTLFPVLPDAIEALIGLGELDQAEPLIEELHAQGQALDRAWALATAARCRGLLAAARGDPHGALAHFQRALQEHQRVTRPFELARTLRAQGIVLRRDKHKTAAKAALEQALGIFEQLGALL